MPTICPTSIAPRCPHARRCLRSAAFVLTCLIATSVEAQTRTWNVQDGQVQNEYDAITGYTSLYKDGPGTLNTYGGSESSILYVRSGYWRLAGDNRLDGSAQAYVYATEPAPTTLALNGPTTSLETDALTIGSSGTGGVGIFELTGGAQARMPGTSTANALVIGHSGQADGRALISGMNSLLKINRGATRIGRDANGALTIEGGGRFESGYMVAIGDQAGSRGEVLVQGPGSLFETTGNAPTYVGRDGHGQIHVRDSGQVHTQYLADVGYTAGSHGNVLIEGPASSWSIRKGLLYIGRRGHGAVTLSDGASLSMDSVSALDRDIILGAEEPGQGLLAIGAPADTPSRTAGVVDARAIRFEEGSGTLILNHTDAPYHLAPELRKGIGTSSTQGHAIQHLAGHTVYDGNGQSFAGTTTIAGGSLTVQGRLHGTLRVQAGAALGGAGQVGSAIIEAHGTLAPGNAWAADGNTLGTLSIAGDLSFMPDARFAVELGLPDAALSDRVQVTGTVFFGDSTAIHLSHLPSTAPAQPAVYTLLEAAGGIEGSPVLADTPPCDCDVSLVQEGQALQLHLTARQIPPPSGPVMPVPANGLWLLLSLSVLSLAVAGGQTRRRG